LSQANFLLESYNVDNVVVLETPDDVVMERALARRVCGECGVDFNLIYHRPADPNICDVCGGKLLARTDDTEVALRKRLADYHAQTEAAVTKFDQKGLAIHIDGTKPIEAVFAEVCGKLKLAVS
jgi:adenylate kinase